MLSKEIKLKMQLGKMDVNYEGDEDEPPELVKVGNRKNSRIFLFFVKRDSILDRSQEIHLKHVSQEHCWECDAPPVRDQGISVGKAQSFGQKLLFRNSVSSFRIRKK